MGCRQTRWLVWAVACGATVGCGSAGGDVATLPGDATLIETDADTSIDAAVDDAPVPSDDVAALSCAVTKPAWGLGEGLMLPGTACIACHAQGQAATDHPFAVAGTVFVGLDCPEPATDAVVTVEGASGPPVTLPLNASGNFYVDVAPPGPWTISVERGGRVVSMAQKAMSGDCNSCHQPAVAGYITLTP